MPTDIRDDIREFFATDWRSGMSEAARKEAARLNDLCPLDRAKAGCEEWQEEGEFKDELKWNLWAKAYKDDFLVPIKEGEEDPFGTGMRQLLRGDKDYGDMEIDFTQGQTLNGNGQFSLNFGNFPRFIFPYITNFGGAIFTLVANFRNTIFIQDFNFTKTKFTKEADFRAATFIDEAIFENAIFSGEALFGGATFLKGAHFDCAIFKQIALFWGAKFIQNAFFQKTIFKQRTDFSRATYMKDANFKQVKFEQDIIFGEVKFLTAAKFQHAVFIKNANFREVLFYGFADFESINADSEMNFMNACFLNGVTFFHGAIKGGMQLHEVGFGYKDYFTKNDNIDYWVKDFLKSYKPCGKTVPNFIGLQLPVTPDLSFTKIDYHQNMKDVHASAKFRKLKEMAGQTQNHAKELEFFREELLHRKHSGEKGKWTRILIWVYETSCF